MATSQQRAVRKLDDTDIIYRIFSIIQVSFFQSLPYPGHYWRCVFVGDCAFVGDVPLLEILPLLFQVISWTVNVKLHTF